MTLHDESNLRLLERELSALAEPQEEDQRIRDALRAQLAIRLQPRPRRRLSLRVALGSSAIAAAAATIALTMLVGTSGSGGPAIANATIIRHTIEAVTPPANAILHVEVVGVQNGVPVSAESWQQTSSPYASRGIKGQLGHQGEFADNGRTSFQYDPRTNTIYEQPDSSRPTFADPISQVRQELARGQALVAGTVLVGGSPLYKIDLPHGLVGYFNTSDYRPRYLDDPQRDGSVVRLRVAVYEYLPMTPSNRALLSMTAQHPSARVEPSRSRTLTK
jgi:hypothetical protein